jgi:hypothetical protein
VPQHIVGVGSSEEERANATIRHNLFRRREDNRFRANAIGIGRLRGGLFGGFGCRHSIKTGNSVQTNLGHGLLRAVSADKATGLDLADDMEVGPLRERGRVFGRPAKYHAAMQSGLRLACSRLPVFPGSLCRERKDRQS